MCKMGVSHSHTRIISIFARKSWVHNSFFQIFKSLRFMHISIVCDVSELRNKYRQNSHKQKMSCLP